MKTRITLDENQNLLLDSGPRNTNLDVSAAYYKLTNDYSALNKVQQTLSPEKTIWLSDDGTSIIWSGPSAFRFNTYSIYLHAKPNIFDLPRYVRAYGRDAFSNLTNDVSNPALVSGDLIRTSYNPNRIMAARMVEDTNAQARSTTKGFKIELHMFYTNDPTLSYETNLHATEYLGYDRNGKYSIPANKASIGYIEADILVGYTAPSKKTASSRLNLGGYASYINKYIEDRGTNLIGTKFTLSRSGKGLEEPIIYTDEKINENFVNARFTDKHPSYKLLKSLLELNDTIKPIEYYAALDIQNKEPVPADAYKKIFTLGDLITKLDSEEPARFKSILDIFI